MAKYENHGNLLRCTKGRRLHYFAHRHREIEVVLMLQGRSKVVVNGEPYEISAGDALVLFPNVLHQYISTEEEDYVLFLIPFGIYRDYSDSIEGHRPVSPLLKGGAEDETLRALAQLCLSEPSQYTYQKNKCLIGAILGILLERIPLTAAPTGGSAVERVLDYCEKHFLDDISLDSMSKDLFLGKFYISRIFGGQLGIRFTNYINALRVEEAVKLLSSTDMPVTDVCFACGFSCTRTFNRAFLNRIGISPREYRASRRNEFTSYIESEKKG